MATEVSIPPPWIATVCEILDSNDLSRIEWTVTAIQDWESQSYGAWQDVCHSVMSRALKNSGVTGRLVYLAEKGETYAFWFMFDSRQFYGKICLREGNVRIKLVSAHEPEKGTDEL